MLIYVHIYIYIYILPPIVHTGSGLENSWKIANEKGDSRVSTLKNFWVIIYTLHTSVQLIVTLSFYLLRGGILEKVGV